MTRICRFAFVLLFAGVVRLSGHPIPHLPVIGSFEANGSFAIEVEVDPRCFAPDPESVPYFTKTALDENAPAVNAELQAAARSLVKRSLRWSFSGEEGFSPAFTFTFEKKGGGAPVEPDDLVTLRGRWRGKADLASDRYRVKVLPECSFKVLTVSRAGGNALADALLLFPGEEGPALHLAELFPDASPASSDSASPAPSGPPSAPWGTFVSFMREGFVHVLPFGLDHLLFVLGLFLLSREWRPLLWQVTAFTIAHTVTLGLAAKGFVVVSGDVVEPLIAASIAYVAVENLREAAFGPRRVFVVFLFGLVHGLGFAGALSDLNLPAVSLLSGLLGFNLGVEAGQLAVLALAFVATAFFRKPENYHRLVVVPGSLAIACMGLYWTVERVFF